MFTNIFCSNNKKVCKKREIFSVCNTAYIIQPKAYAKAVNQGKP